PPPAMIEPRVLDEILDRYDEVNALLSRPEVATDPERLAVLGRERAELETVVGAVERYRALLKERGDLRALVRSEEGETAELAEAELEEVEARLPAAEAHLERLLIPRDPEDARDAIVEIRAGTGGDEAALFAGDLFELYGRYAAQQKWRVEVMDASPGTAG